MLAYQGLHARDEIITLLYEPQKVGTAGDRIYFNQHSVESYEVMQHFDTLAQQAMGTYASRIITHNMYDKSYNIKDYHYHDQFADMFHVDQVSNRSKRNFAMSDTPVDNDPKGYAPGDKTVSDYPDSQVVLQGSTRFLHGENTGIFGTDPDSEGLTEAIRMSQENQVTNSMRVKIVVPGHSYLQAGDLIRFKLPSLEPNKGEGKTQLDEFHSGRYIVSKLRHRVIDGYYKMILECVKDSVVREYTNLSDENFAGKEPPQGQTQNLETYEDITTTGAKKGYTYGL
jgi:hypothetical protein